MGSPLVLLLVGLSYIVLFGVISLLKREGLSLRFALEAIMVTALVSILTASFGGQTHPVLFLIVLYVVTMRVRLLVDLGNIFARRRRFDWADRLYALALRLWPDISSRFIVQVNQGTLLLQRDRLDEAISLFMEVLSHADQGYLGVKYEAAAYYNLAVAYQRKHMEAGAVQAFNKVIDTWPGSEFAQRAARALEKHRRQIRAVDTGEEESV